MHFHHLIYRVNEMKTNRRIYVIYKFIDYLIYLTFALISLIYIIIYHKALLTRYDDIHILPAIYLFSVVLGIISEIIYIKQLYNNFDNQEDEYVLWIRKIKGDSDDIKVFKFFSTLFGYGFWITGWIFISNYGNIDFEFFKDQYHTLANTMIIYWIYLTSSTSIIILGSLLCYLFD